MLADAVAVGAGGCRSWSVKFCHGEGRREHTVNSLPILTLCGFLATVMAFPTLNYKPHGESVNTC